MLRVFRRCRKEVGSCMACRDGVHADVYVMMILGTIMIRLCPACMKGMVKQMRKIKM